MMSNYEIAKHISLMDDDEFLEVMELICYEFHKIEDKTVDVWFAEVLKEMREKAEDPDDYKKILIGDKFDNSLLIVTNAPLKVVETFCKNSCSNANTMLVKWLDIKHYDSLVLYDSDDHIGIDTSLIDAIGYEHKIDINDYIGK